MPEKMEIKIIEEALKVVDRLISAYERSQEIELEKEKVAAELELGCRRIALEEKRLKAEFKVVMRQIDLAAKKLDACIREMDSRIEMQEAYQKKTLEYCDRLLLCMCKEKDESRRERMERVFFSLHSGMVAQMNASSENFKQMLGSVSAVGRIACNSCKAQLLQ